MEEGGRGAGFRVKGGEKETIIRERNYATRLSAQIARDLGALSDTERFEFGLVSVKRMQRRSSQQSAKPFGCRARARRSIKPLKKAAPSMLFGRFIP
jgi:hypothetical protein